jgi:hypothetical protein
MPLYRPIDIDRKPRARESILKIVLESCRRRGALNHDQIIVLPPEAGRGKVRGSGAQRKGSIQFRFLHPHARTATVLGDEFDACGLQGVLHGLNCFSSRGSPASFEASHGRNCNPCRVCKP